MPLYVGDYLRDTRRLSTVEHGAYLLLIMEYWTSGGLPDNDEQLRRITGMAAAEWRRSKEIIQEFFYDGWHHKKIDAELARSGEISRKRSASAKVKHANAGANAGANRPAQAELLPTQPQPQPQPPSEESKKDGADAPIDVRFYQRAKQVLGQRSGGSMGTKIVKAYDGNFSRAMVLIENASGRASPIEYVSKALSNLHNPEVGLHPRY
jgi:uncharacterized protein YdaU (DUF1376 family)